MRLKIIRVKPPTPDSKKIDVISSISVQHILGYSGNDIGRGSWTLVGKFTKQSYFAFEILLNKFTVQKSTQNFNVFSRELIAFLALMLLLIIILYLIAISSIRKPLWQRIMVQLSVHEYRVQWKRTRHARSRTLTVIHLKMRFCYHTHYFKNYAYYPNCHLL